MSGEITIIRWEKFFTNIRTYFIQKASQNSFWGKEEIWKIIESMDSRFSGLGTTEAHTWNKIKKNFRDWLNNQPNIITAQDAEQGYEYIVLHQELEFLSQLGRNIFSEI